MAASRKSIQCFSFMFEQYSILMMLIPNAIIIMYELFGRKKRFAVSRSINIKKMDSKAKVLPKASFI